MTAALLELTVGMVGALSITPATAGDAGLQSLHSLVVQEFASRWHDIEVAPMPGLAARQGCRFFTARDPKLVGGPTFGYAVLPDQAVLGARQQDRAERILAACGQGADALWWAAVAARFGDAGGLLVDEHAPSAIRRIRASGAPDHRPTLTRSTEGTVVTFYTHDYARSQTWRVKATLTPQGELRIDRTPL